VPLRRSAPLPRGLPPKRRVPVRKMRLRPRRGPDRSPDYLAWIRTLGCVICSTVSGGVTAIEAAHTNALGARGMGQKTTDFSAIPLCSGHHREYPDSYHRLGEQGFSRAHGIDLQELVLLLQGRFRQQDVSASRLVHPVQVCMTVARPLGCGKLEM
jgi:hypothetical protein